MPALKNVKNVKSCSIILHIFKTLLCIIQMNLEKSNRTNRPREYSFTSFSYLIIHYYIQFLHSKTHLLKISSIFNEIPFHSYVSFTYYNNVV